MGQRNEACEAPRYESDTVLPLDIWGEICNHVTVRDLTALACVCKPLYRVVLECPMWHHHCLIWGFHGTGSGCCQLTLVRKLSRWFKNRFPISLEFGCSASMDNPLVKSRAGVKRVIMDFSHHYGLTATVIAGDTICSSFVYEQYFDQHMLLLRNRSNDAKRNMYIFSVPEFQHREVKQTAPISINHRPQIMDNYSANFAKNGLILIYSLQLCGSSETYFYLAYADASERKFAERVVRIRNVQHPSTVVTEWLFSPQLPRLVRWLRSTKPFGGVTPVDMDLRMSEELFVAVEDMLQPATRLDASSYLQGFQCGSFIRTAS